MRNGQFALAFAVCALVTAASAPAEAAGKTTCKQIFDICMKRAGSGHAAICEDMYAQARRNGQWQATEDEQGHKYPPVPCTP